MQRPLQIHVELCDQFTRIACNNLKKKDEKNYDFLKIQARATNFY